MKKITMIISAATLLLAIGFANHLKAQTVQKEAGQPKPIPADVRTALERSCLGCHSENGNTLAIMKVNFTKWDEYSAGKQASAAQNMCNEVSKNKMPPKKFLENNPAARPTDKEKSVICDWAATLPADK